MELLQSSAKKSLLDPRTKLLLLLLVGIVILGNAGGEHLAELRYVLYYLPAFLALCSRRWRTFLYAVCMYSAGFALQFLVVPFVHGLAAYLVLAVSGIFLRFVPGIICGAYVVSTTTVSEFISAMERMHVPKQITIPLSVMFRFFPTVAEEASSINKAMTMRDIRFGGKKAFKMIEYRLVPLMTCSVKIGQELSAASLTRGLGGPDKRTNICKIGFGFFDYLTFILVAAGVAYAVLSSLNVIPF